MACAKHDDCRAIRNRVVNWMKLHREEHRDRSTGEVNATTLAESAAYAFDHLEWLDDSVADVWDWAAEVAE